MISKKDVDNISYNQFNKLRQVFPCEKWDELLGGLRKCLCSDCCVVCSEYNNRTKNTTTTNTTNTDTSTNNTGSATTPIVPTINSATTIPTTTTTNITQTIIATNVITDTNTKNTTTLPICICRPKTSISYLLHTPVLPNKFISIPGNHNVSVLFIINSYSSNYYDLLRVETKQQIDNDNNTNLINKKLMELGILPTNTMNFPYIPVSRLFYSPLLVGLMSQQASWSVVENKEKINELLGL